MCDFSSFDARVHDSVGVHLAFLAYSNYATGAMGIKWSVVFCQFSDCFFVLTLLSVCFLSWRPFHELAHLALIFLGSII